MSLSSNAKVYLEAFYGGPKFQTLTPEQVNDMMGMVPAPEILEVEGLANVEDRQIAVKDGEITVRIYTPVGEGPFPLFVYYHGGGWVLGDLNTSDAGCRLLAAQTKRVVVSVEYRLAPEYRFPVPVEDCYAALTWANTNAASMNAIADDIVVGGDSAGGNLAAVMAILSRNQNGPMITAQALIYPVTNLDFSTASYNEFAEGFGLDRDLMIWFGDYYVNDASEYKDVRVSPLLDQDVSALPPAIIVAAENDVLRTEGVQFYDKLKAAGVQTSYNVVEGCIHGYFSNMALFAEETKYTVDQISQFLQSVQSPTPLSKK